VERVAGTALLSPALEGEYSLVTAVLPHAEAVCKKTENGYEAEGVVTAEILLKNAEGGYKSATLHLPFVFPITASGDFVEADCMACGLNVRRTADGETQAEAIVKLSLCCYEETQTRYICEVAEGEKLEQSNAAVTLFIPRAGDDLWTVANRRHLAPEEPQKSNPDLQFPVREGERIFVYRQIK
jgi:hypothetical protein